MTKDDFDKLFNDISEQVTTNYLSAEKLEECMSKEDSEFGRIISVVTSSYLANIEITRQVLLNILDIEK